MKTRKTLYIDQALWDKVECLAKKNDRKPSNQAVLLIKNGIEAGTLVTENIKPTVFWRTKEGDLISEDELKMEKQNERL